MTQRAGDSRERDALLGEAWMAGLADAGLGLADVESDVAGIEVVIERSAQGLTRFANSQIHQNVWWEDIQAGVRVVTRDGSIGVAGAHTDDPALVRQAARDALEIARLTPPDPEFPGLAPSAGVPESIVDMATAAASPEARAAAVRMALAEIPDEFEGAGAYQTVGAELGVFTTEGQAAYAPTSAAQLTLVVMGDSSSGYAEDGGRSTGAIDPAAAARTAVAKARAGADPVDAPAGDWHVVLEPAATGALVQFLAYLGLGGREYLEGRSFASGRLGHQVVDDKVTIVDDATSADTVGFAVDWEGTPKRRVELIRDGVLSAVVHDRFTGRKAGAESTGHGLPAPNAHGPVAINPLMLPGEDGTIDDLIEGVERGLLVTRFHYTNVVHPVETKITGMTRDGTFLISEGKITHGVRNLRFTESILRALASVERISSETSYASELFFGGSRCPAVRLPSFHFTGTTSFG
ncbi:MAG TPA: TldD/PmbA family protein [Egibacteraceae bacterium]|nr:TldD/PmbA family protein [Egibacteraceae bacterium]